MKHTKLRAKTGCFICRIRKVKCGEEKPICNNCQTNTRPCIWPNANELVDRRWRSHSFSHTRSLSLSQSCSQVTPNSERPAVCPLYPSLCESVTDLEVSLIHYFHDVQYPAFLLPDVATDFFAECRWQYLEFARCSESVRKSIIACSASNKAILAHDSRFARLGLRYHADAISSVNSTLRDISTGKEEPDDSLLAAVIFLYLYELWGPDEASHASAHITGAVHLFTICHRVVTLRPQPNETSGHTITSPINCLMAESILYQSIMLSLRNPFHCTYKMDMSLLSWMEAALPTLSREDSMLTQRSAVLGLPLQLYRLILDTIVFHNSSESTSTEMSRLKREMQVWDDFAVALHSKFQTAHFNKELILYIFAASLLLDWVSELSHDVGDTFVSCMPLQEEANKLLEADMKLRWQADKAISVLRVSLVRDEPALCYLGSWPLLILGYAVHLEEDISIVKQVLVKIWRATGYGEIKRILQELEDAWSRRISGRNPIIAISKQYG